MKQCRTCNEIKPLDQFPSQLRVRFGASDTRVYRKDCKPCTAAHQREYMKTYTPKPKREAPTEDANLLLAVRARVNDAKGRAAKRDIPYDLDDASMVQLWLSQEGKCAISGIPLALKIKHPHVLSLDQKDPGKGYTVGNVQWVSWSVNRAKGDLSMADFIDMCRRVIEGVTTIREE